MGKSLRKKASNGNGHEPQSAAINLRVIAAFTLFASKEETRYMLNGVCIELEERHTTYIATDGHRIITRRDELIGEESNTLLGVHVIPTAHCTKFTLEKDAEGRALLFANGSRLTIQYGLEEHTFPGIEGVFPDWRKSIPSGKPSGVRAQFNAKYITDLGKLCKQLELGQHIIETNGDAPAHIFFNDKRVFGGIMPVKTLDMSDRTAPIWTRRGGPERDQGDIEDLVLVPYDDDLIDPETGECIPKDGPPKLLPPPPETPPDADHPSASY